MLAFPIVDINALITDFQAKVEANKNFCLELITENST
jgi:hypothetical protein